MPDRLGPVVDSKPASASSRAVALQPATRNTGYSGSSSARAFNESRESDVAMRGVRATECIATAITNKQDSLAHSDESIRELIAWAAPACQQELDALVTAYDRAYGSGLGLTYLRVYLRDLPDDLATRLKRADRMGSGGSPS
jgi:hypothetical protein